MQIGQHNSLKIYWHADYTVFDLFEKNLLHGMAVLVINLKSIGISK